MDQIGEPVPDRTCDEQSRQRLFRSVSADRTACTSALLIDSAGGLTHLVSDISSDALNRICSLNCGSRHLAGQIGGLVHSRRGAFLQISEHGLPLIDSILSQFSYRSAETSDRAPDLRRRIAHDIHTSLLIHRPLPLQMAFRRYQPLNKSASQNAPL